nr:hypothetical protein [Vulcanisaeta sp.]
AFRAVMTIFFTIKAFRIVTAKEVAIASDGGVRSLVLDLRSMFPSLRTTSLLTIIMEIIKELKVFL